MVCSLNVVNSFGKMETKEIYQFLERISIQYLAIADAEVHGQVSTDILTGRTITCTPETPEGLIAAGIDYWGVPIIRDRNWVSCQGTEDLPAWGRLWMAESR